ncbi:MAG: hypothetical protein JWQ07_2639 [Ramlibacter sp.]|nr:hypothetical protein [Ramlibacter sp.]
MRRIWSLAGWAGALFLLVSCGGGGSDVGSPVAASAVAPQRAAAYSLDPAALFRWAPTHYGQYFSGGYRTDPAYQQYQHRCYPLTGNCLGVAGDQVYVKLGAGDPFPVGSLASFDCEVYPSHCPVTTAPVSEAAALSGFYVGDLNGLSPYAFAIFAADGSFIGVNQTDTRFDVFTGNAVAQAGTWSATNARYGAYTSNTLYANLGSADMTGAFTNTASASATVAVSGVTPIGTQLALIYQTFSSTPSSLWIGGGLYSVPSRGQAIQIDTSTGAVSGTIQTNCAITGTLSVPAPARNVYKLSASLSGTSCPMQGAVDFLGYYDSSTTTQALNLYGTTPGSQLAYISFAFIRPPA